MNDRIVYNKEILEVMKNKKIIQLKIELKEIKINFNGRNIQRKKQIK